MGFYFCTYACNKCSKCVGRTITLSVEDAVDVGVGPAEDAVDVCLMDLLLVLWCCLLDVPAEDAVGVLAGPAEDAVDVKVGPAELLLVLWCCLIVVVVV